VAETEIDYLIGRLRFERAQTALMESPPNESWREDLNVALETFRRVRDQRVKLLEDVADDPYYENLLGVALDELAVVLWQTSAKDESLATSREATKHLRKTFDNSPQLLDYRTNLASHYRNRSYLEWRKISSGNGAALYEVAAALAATAAAASEGASDVSESDRSRWLDQAVETIAEAVKAGIDASTLRDDPALKPLSEHKGFQELLKDGG
jgi:hypothetical protein